MVSGSHKQNLSEIADKFFFHFQSVFPIFKASVGCPRKSKTSQTDKFIRDQTFYHYLGQKYYEKSKKKRKFLNSKTYLAPSKVLVYNAPV